MLTKNHPDCLAGSPLNNSTVLQRYSKYGTQVENFVRNMQRGDNFTPIEVLWVQKGNDDYYFAFGGCHRWEAHKRLGKLASRLSSQSL